MFVVVCGRGRRGRIKAERRTRPQDCGDRDVAGGLAGGVTVLQWTVLEMRGERERERDGWWFMRLGKEVEDARVCSMGFGLGVVSGSDGRSMCRVA